MNKLNELANKYRSDKGYKHGYTKYYDKFFSDFQDKEINILEIGFGEGASIKMWLDYFPFAKVYCIDIGNFIQTDIKIERFIKFSGDQSNEDDLDSFIRFFGKNSFDIIIDDGSHRSEDQVFTMNFLFPYLKSNGLYVIEDMNCRRIKTEKFGVKEGDMSKIISDFINHNVFNANILSSWDNKYLERNIKEINMYDDKICFIRKK